MEKRVVIKKSTLEKILNHLFKQIDKSLEDKILIPSIEVDYQSNQQDLFINFSDLITLWLEPSYNSVRISYSIKNQKDDGRSIIINHIIHEFKMQMDNIKQSRRKPIGDILKTPWQISLVFTSEDIQNKSVEHQVNLVWNLSDQLNNAIYQIEKNSHLAVLAQIDKLDEM